MKRLAIPTMFMALAACATASEAGPEAEPITIRVDNMTSRVITVERYIGSTIARRVGLVNGQSQRVLTIPWHPSRLAHQLLRLEGVARVATGAETGAAPALGYGVEECYEGVCALTGALHLPPGAEVSLVIDTRGVARMYYNRPAGPPQ
ncbi:MAG: hypothetical protein F4107_00665 [Gemmatimonadetes bacterium]|nr:hypothetical protein [Gemmatimonadota bacterium]MYD12857.1 hypothetical protein [Gemmatimonadota bacterium]MYI64439.1 hypothetical protein [Gemmatimonadota bacterium]